LERPCPSRRKGCRTSLRGVLPNLSSCPTLVRFGIKEGAYEHDAQSLFGATLGRPEDRLVSRRLDEVGLRPGLTRRDPEHPPRRLPGLRPGRDSGLARPWRKRPKHLWSALGRYPTLEYGRGVCLPEEGAGETLVRLVRRADRTACADG